MRCVGALAVVAWSSVAFGQGALDKAAFTATAAELLAIAKTAPTGADSVVLREEYEVAVDDKGLIRTRTRVVTALLTQAGVDSWRSLSVEYDPSFQDKATLRARVIFPDGTTKTIDPASVTDVHDEDDGYTGIEAPLPTLPVGSIVEQEYVLSDRLVLAGFWQVTLGNSSPTLSTRVSITAPTSSKIRVAASGAKMQPKVTASGPRTTWRYEVGKLPARTPYETMVPHDVVQFPAIGLAITPSWTKVATDYAATVDKVIADGKPSMPSTVTTTSPADAVKSVTRWVHGMISIDDQWLETSKLVPASPAETMKRRKGSTLDAATLMVALLRQANVRADLVLVRHSDQVGGAAFVRALPTLRGFDGVLVRTVVGATTTWVDPALPYSVNGQLTWTAQGALALVIAPDTTDLVITPATSSKDNVHVHTRTYQLSELNYMSLEETVRYGGTFEPIERQWHAETTKTNVRNNIERYAKSEYSNAEVVDHTWTTPADNRTPFETKLRAKRSERGYTDRERIDVYLFPSDAVRDVPYMLRESKADAPKRVFDLQLQHPHKSIIETHLVVPPGFKMPAAAAVKKRTLGPMTLVETQRVDKNELIVTFELDTVKSRLTPAEVVAAQAAFRALDAEGALHIVIDNIGASLLAAGKAREAIAEYERMIALHPKESVHHGALAQAYLAVGAGLAARRAAKKGTELEPKNADAFVQLGWILEYDELGRRFTGNFDRAGSKAALEKALQLEPRHLGAMTELGLVLERNAQGGRFELGSDLAGAAAWYWKAHGLGAGIESGFNYLAVQLWAGKFDKLVEDARAMDTSSRRDTLMLAAIAASKGGAAGVQEAATLASSSAARTKLLNSAAGLLMLIRKYEPMRLFFTEAQPNIGGQDRVFAAIERGPKPFKPGKDPHDALAELLIAQILPGRRHDVYWDKRVREDFEESARSANVAATFNRDVMTSTFLEDLLRATAAQATLEGDAKAMRLDLDVGKERTRVFLVEDRGVAKIIGGDKAWDGVGRYLFNRLAAGDEATATRILDWLAKDAPQMRGEMLGFAIPELWGPKLPKTKQAMALAAAVIAGTSMADRVLPIVEKCGATTTAGQEFCDLVAADCLVDQQRWHDLEDHAKQWQARSKSNPLPISYRVHALVRVRNFDEAEKIIDDALANDPAERMLLAAKSDIAIGRGQLAEAVKRLEAITTLPGTPSVHYNNLAWLMLVEGSDIKGALAVAQKAHALDATSSHALHTLASIEAEVGELVKAWRHGIDAAARTREGVNGGTALYLHGRILEAVGLKDDAIAAYRRIKRDPKPSITLDSFGLAQKRLTGLGAKP